MKQIQSPTEDFRKVTALIDKEPECFRSLFILAEKTPYYPWRYVKYHSPDGVEPDLWWQLLLMTRRMASVDLLVTDRGIPFRFSMPDALQKGLHEIDTGIGFAIQNDEVFHGLAPERLRTYLQRSQAEEAISSSQMEGAVTTSVKAREMIASGSAPKNESERMILNNFETMRSLTEWKSEPLSFSLLSRIHSRLTTHILPVEKQGHLRGNADQIVVQRHLQVLHTPPSAEKLRERLERLFEFTNETDSSPFIHPVAKAMMLHFMIGYEHPFCDGNGRTARVLFYWYLLRHEPHYWLLPYLSISSVLKEKEWNKSYGQSYLDVENGLFDLTYFLLFQVQVLKEAVDRFHRYVHQVQQNRRNEAGRLPPGVNRRQIDLLDHLKRNPDAVFTAAGHGLWHNISPNTARKDLAALEEMGYLRLVMRGKRMTYIKRK